ncbi:hypothetical protein D3C74_426200 [compost metagenome]
MGAQIGDDHVAQLIHKHEPYLRLAVHHFLGAVVALGRSAFDQIAGNGKRRSGKGDQRHIKLFVQNSYSLQDMAEIAFHIDWLQPLHIRSIADRIVDNGTDVLHNVEFHAKGSNRIHDI